MLGYLETGTYRKYSDTGIHSHWNTQTLAHADTGICRDKHTETGVLAPRHKKILKHIDTLWLLCGYFETHGHWNTQVLGPIETRVNRKWYMQNLRNTETRTYANAEIHRHWHSRH